MQRTWKLGLLSLALVALAGAGIASAHGGWDGKAAEECSDDMTVAECRDAVQDARQQKMLERCTAEYDAEFCAGLQDLREEQRAEMVVLLEEYGIEGKVHFRTERDAEPPNASCSGDMTVADCRETHRAEAEQARSDACSAEYGQEFCTAFFDLRSEHREEIQAYFETAGHEVPERGPRGPGGLGPGDKRGPGRH